MAEITCCTGQTECNHLVTVGYLKSFIGTNIKDTGGTTVYVNTIKDDSYVPTYSELTNNNFIQQYVDAGANKWHSSIDGITVNGTYAADEEVEQSDLVLTYIRFKSLSISAGKTTFDECSDSTNITATYKLTKTVKAMNNCVTAETSTEGSDTTCKPSFSGSCNWLTLGSCSNNKITASAGKNGDWSAATRSCNVKTTVKYKGQTYTSNTIAITQEALTGSYSVYEGRHYTATTITSHDDLDQNTCSGATVNASATAYYYDRYKWKDSCGKIYEYNYDDRYSSESAGSASYTFDPVYCPTEYQIDTYVMTITYQGYSDSVTFRQICQQDPPCPECSDTTEYGECNVTEYVDACGGDVILSCAMPTTIHHMGWDGTGHCIETATTHTAYTQTAVVTIPENKIQGGSGAISSYTGSITTEEGGVINYTVIQDISNPCGGCGEEFSSYTFSDVSIPCQAFSGEVEVDYVLTKSYSVTACADVQESGKSAYTIVISDCNETNSDKDFISGGTLGSFVIHQAAGSGICCCSCSDFSLQYNQLTWSSYSDTSTRHNPFPDVYCIDDGITATSDDNWFTASVSSGSIDVTPRGQNITTDEKTATITVRTKVKGSDCPIHTFTVTQPAYGCSCDDFSASTTSLSWNEWNDTAPKIATYSANSECIDSSSINATSDDNWFSASASNGVVTISPSGENRTLSVKSATVSINFTSNGAPCHKDILVSQPAYVCRCEDLSANTTSLSWTTWNDLTPKTASYSFTSTCINANSISATSNNNWFTVTNTINGTNGIVSVSPSGNNTTLSAKTAVVSISYYSNGTLCHHDINVSQPGYGCGCGDLSASTSSLSWSAWDDTDDKIVTYSANSTCIDSSDISVSSNTTWFTASNSNGVVTISPSGENRTLSAKTGIVSIKYVSDGNQCHHDIDVSQPAYVCSCDDLTVDSNPSAWDWDDTSQKTATFSFNPTCYTSSDMSIDVTGSSRDWFTVTSSMTTNSGTLRISPSGTNTSTTVSKIATIVISYGDNCTKKIALNHKRQGCSCEDLTITPISNTIPANGSQGMAIATVGNERGCFNVFSFSSSTTWLTVFPTLSNNQIGASVASNPNCTSRSAEITVEYSSANTSICTTSFTVTQAARSCSCSDVTLDIAASIDLECSGATNQVIGTYEFTCATCRNTALTVSKSSSLSGLTITLNEGDILASYSTTTSLISGTLTIKYGNSTCKTVTIRQNKCCSCDDLEVNTGRTVWEWDETTAHTVGFSFTSSCVDASDINVSVTEGGSSVGWFTINSGITGSNGSFTITPSGPNPGIIGKSATIVIRYGNNCKKNIALYHKSEGCACSDLTLAPYERTIPASGESGVLLAEFSTRAGHEECFNVFNVTSSDYSWLYPQINEVSSGKYISARVSANSTCNSRTATVTLEYSSANTSVCTSAFTVTQAPHICTCSDLDIQITSTTLDCSGATDQEIGTIKTMCQTCTGTFSKAGNFSNLSITFANGRIYATYPAASSTKTGTLIIRYNGVNCVTETLTQYKCCDCDDLTVGTGRTVWNWDETTAHTVAFSFTSSCYTSSDLSVDVTGSSSSWFTVTSGITGSNGSFTITPSGSNSTIQYKTASIRIRYGNNCKKEIALAHKPDACSCDDLSVIPATQTPYPAAGTGSTYPVTLATVVNTRNCFDVFSFSSDSNWISVYPVLSSNNSIDGSVSENKTCSARTGTVTVTYSSAYTNTCTTSFTISQAARSCTTGDVTVNISASSLTCSGATGQTIGTYEFNCATCRRTSLNSGGTFSDLEIEFDEFGNILATYPPATSSKSGTVVVKYGSTTITSKTLSQEACCGCDDFSISPTAATWTWDKYGQSVASSITVTLGDCISNYTLSSLSHFTATKSARAITVYPNIRNTGASDISETLTITHYVNGVACTEHKTVILKHTPKSCDCSDIDISIT